ncbi:hypothetical protein P0243_12215 [Enterobacter cloacae]|uniref:hypothetical protein n=1 Tax=Enterobacter cloacae TaxID=550 RepID=UPI0034D79A76
MSNIDKQAGEGDVNPKTYYIHPAAFGSTENPGYGHVAVVKAEDFEKLRAKLDAAESRIAELEAREVKPVAWMRSANVTSFMSRFTTDEKYAVEQWGDDAVALYPLPVAFIPACFTDERNLMHINERGRETSLIWSKQNSDSGDIKLFRIAAAAGKGE